MYGRTGKVVVRRVLYVLVVALLILQPVCGAKADTKGLAEHLLSKAGIRKGICSFPRCGAGELAVAVAQSSNFLVHGQDADVREEAVQARGEDLLPFDIPPERGGGMPPVYRHDARSDSTGGRVLLKLAIDTAGRMMGVHVVGSDPGLMKAAVLSAALWDYVPATLMGSYVPSHMYRYVRFDPPEEMAELERSTEWRTKFDTPPRLVHKVLPEYPDPALLAEFEGVVRAEIRIDATGKVVRVIPRDGPRAFHDSVIAAVPSIGPRPGALQRWTESSS